MMRISIKKIETTLNAFDIYSLFKEEENTIFLDSSKESDGLGGYSFIGLNPFKIITYKEGVLREDGIIKEGELFETLNRIIRTHQVVNTSELPFVGGCMGYFAYDLGLEEEAIVSHTKKIMDLPTAYFIFYDNIVVYDHSYNHVYITELCRMNGCKTGSQQIEERIKAGQPISYGKTEQRQVPFTSKFTQAAYMQRIEAMRQYIKQGDIYIANMTQTYFATTDRKAYDIYKNLRRINPAPFSAYLALENIQIMSSSPERFISIRKGYVKTRPIKGTRPRGKTEEEDIRLALELEESEKDKSELLMVVDLERNDLSKVCRPYTVKVTELFKIESYATVHHLVATIVGHLEKGETSVDCLKACFPGGSITGTPKIRAMEIIDELELNKRHIYTGCIGYFGLDGEADFNIVIRTLIQQGKALTLGVGGGITWESEAGAEYQETLDKAEALFEAVRTYEVKNESNY